MTVKIGYSISDVSAIKALPTALLTNGYARLCRSVNAWFSYNSASTATADDVSILLPASGTGRWFKLKADVAATDVLNFSEAVDDRVASLVANSSTIDASYNDATNTLIFSIVAGSVGDAELEDSGVASGSYTNADITVDAKGRVIAASDGTSSSGIAWEFVTANLTASVNKKYINNKSGSQLEITLPTTSAAFDTLSLASNTSFGFKFLQNASQYIQNEEDITSAGVLGGIESTQIGSCVDLVCTIPDIAWLVVNKLGTVSNYFNGVTDTDALAVIAAIEATGVSLSVSTELIIEQRIVDAKADGVWSKFVAYYGYVGGTAAAHAINWKNPSLYNITWTGSFTHDSSGVKGNGTYPSATSYGNTGIAASSVLTAGNVGLGFYTTSTRANDINYDIGCYSPSPTRLLTSYIYTGAYGYYGGGATNIAESGTYDSSKKYYSGSRIGTSIKSYKNGAVFASATDSDNALPTTNIYVCNLNFNGVGTAPSVCAYGSHCINTGLTDTEEADNYASELAFQTALGRN